MSGRFVVSGTDTGLGKTVVAAMLVQTLDASYYKPVQAGLDEETDTETVQRLIGFADDRFIPEAYRLATPASPHLAAEIDGVEIDPEGLDLPETTGPLIVEGAGGLLVPLTRRVLYIDVFARWGAPVVLCARTALGTINHTLLSVAALMERDVPLLGIAFVGDENADSERTIIDFTGARRLGRLPFLDPLDGAGLARAFADHFDAAAFAI